MSYTPDLIEAPKDPSATHADAFSAWLHSKTLQNESNKTAFFDPRRVTTNNGVDRLDSHSGCTLVLVEDEPVVAITLAEILERREFRVLWFTDPVEALACIKGRQPDLLLTDVTMPILDGLNLAVRVKSIYPDCPILLFSALTDDPPLMDRMVASGLNLTIEAKPLQISRLVECMTKLLSTPSLDKA